MVTRTLLDNWNREKGSRVFPPEHLPLAEQMLADLAYALHTSDRMLTERDVKTIACAAMDTFYQRPAGQTSDVAAEEFITVLRSSSGLFVESGQNLFSFMHRTFQEYYVAQYLLRKPFQELQAFVKTQYSRALWREPQLLAIAAKSEQNKQEASELIRTIASTCNDYDTILHTSLLFATRSLADCNTLLINHQLQHDIAHRLFDLYGDSFGKGRYTQLQQEIEEVTLLWLCAQPQESSQHTTLPPLLQAWHTALCDPSNPLRQEGATHLLASLAPDLPGCPKLVLSSLIPPLLKLANVEDLPCPPEVRAQLARTQAQPASLKIEEYAFIALRLLDKDGPAGWLHHAWLTWNEEQPALLERLTQHSLELDYLLTPAAFPTRYAPEHPYWQAQIKLGNEWEQRGQRNPGSLQTALLHASDSTRYPHAYFYWTLLKAEETALGVPWRTVWDTVLCKEMGRGQSATYQTCLYLRLLLCQGNQQQRERIATELVTALSKNNRLQALALITITNLCLLGRQNLQYPLNRHDLESLIDLDYLRYPPSRDDLTGRLDLEGLLYLRSRLDLRGLLNKEQLVDILCNLLIHQGGISSAILLAMNSILSSYETLPSQVTQPVQYSLQQLERQARQSLTMEDRQLIAIIRRTMRLSTSPATIYTSARHGTPDTQVVNLYKLRQQRQLTESEVEEVLLACTDTRSLYEATGERVVVYSVDGVAWGLLNQPFGLNNEVISLVIRFLDDADARICAAAALLLKNNSKHIPENLRKEAALKVLDILRDDELSRRPLDTPDYEFWRLDDVLFETLKVLGE